MKTLTDVRRYRWWLLPMTVLIALVVAMTARPERAAPERAAPERAAPERAAPERAAPGAGIDRHASHTALAAPEPDAVLRLEALLGHHSVLAADLMRGRIRSQEDFLAAASAALGRNTDEISKLVGSWYGDEAAKRFGAVWAKHLDALVAYARGLANQDAQTRAEARSNLQTFERDIGGFFAELSQGRLSQDAAHAAVLAHVDHLLRQADAFAAGDHAAADRIYREGYRHTYGLGLSLGRALLPPAQAAALDAPPWQLRSELNRLLAEHVEAVVDASRAGVLDKADFDAAGATVNANTRELAAAMGTLFGAAAAARFQSIWADHIDQVMAYTAGVVDNDSGAKDEAKARLRGVERQLATFLADATKHQLNSAALTKTLVRHDEMLLAHAEAFVARDYVKAHDIADTTFAHMYDVSGALAAAFTATVGSRMPVGGPATGLGGMAGVVGRR